MYSCFYCYASEWCFYCYASEWCFYVFFSFLSISHSFLGTIVWLETTTTEEYRQAIHLGIQKLKLLIYYGRK